MTIHIKISYVVKLVEGLKTDCASVAFYQEKKADLTGVFLRSSMEIYY